MTERYRHHDPMGDPGEFRGCLGVLPNDVPGLVAVVQNTLLHQHMAEWTYGIALEPERLREPWLRTVREKLAWTTARGWPGLQEPRKPEERMVGICRDFSVLGVSLFREAGIPARARCGFATYFEPGKFMDHWVVEWWDPQRGAWRYTDAQIDTAQARLLKVDFDPLDVPRTRFLTGAEAWIRAREGGADPQTFGIFEWWGWDYLACNLLLDVNSVLGAPFQPWDTWPGYKARPAANWNADDWTVLDGLARAVLGTDLDDGLGPYVAAHPGIGVPEDWNRVENTLETRRT